MRRHPGRTPTLPFVKKITRPIPHRAQAAESRRMSAERKTSWTVGRPRPHRTARQGTREGRLRSSVSGRRSSSARACGARFMCWTGPSMREASFATRKWYTHGKPCRLGRPGPSRFQPRSLAPRQPEKVCHDECTTTDESEIGRPFLFASRRSGVRST